MPTQITQIELPRSETSALKVIGENGEQPDRSRSESLTRGTAIVPTVFKVEGTLYLRDAELLEKICRDVGNQTKRPVTLELAGLSYLDSDSAAVITLAVIPEELDEHDFRRCTKIIVRLILLFPLVS